MLRDWYAERDMNKGEDALTLRFRLSDGAEELIDDLHELAAFVRVNGVLPSKLGTNALNKRGEESKRTRAMERAKTGAEREEEEYVQSAGGW